MRPTCRLHVRETVSFCATRKKRVAGVGSTTPSGLTAAPLNVCPVWASGDAGVYGFTHATRMLSIRHTNVDPGTVDANANDGVEFHVSPAGPNVIDVSG